MKILIAVIFSLMSLQVFAVDLSTTVFQDDKVYCVKYKTGADPTSTSWDAGLSISCVSQASIKKDKAELELIQYQIDKIKKELEKESATKTKTKK